MSKPISETEARLQVLESRVRNIEAFLELREGYSTIKGQQLIDERKRMLELKAQRTRDRLEKEKLPPRIHITKAAKEFAGSRFIMNFINMREEGAQINRQGYVGPEAYEQLQAGNPAGLLIVHMKKDLNRAILATKSDVEHWLPNEFDGPIYTSAPVEVELHEEAFQKKGYSAISV